MLPVSSLTPPSLRSPVSGSISFMAENVLSVFKQGKVWVALAETEKKILEQFLLGLNLTELHQRGQYICCMIDGSTLNIDTTLPDRIILQIAEGERYTLVKCHPLYSDVINILEKCSQTATSECISQGSYPPFSLAPLFYCLSHGDTSGIQHYLWQIIHPEMVDDLLREYLIPVRERKEIFLLHDHHEAMSTLITDIIQLTHTVGVSAEQSCSLIRKLVGDRPGAILMALPEKQHPLILVFHDAMEKNSSVAVKACFQLMRDLSLTDQLRLLGSYAYDLAGDLAARPRSSNKAIVTLDSELINLIKHSGIHCHDIALLLTDAVTNNDVFLLSGILLILTSTALSQSSKIRILWPQNFNLRSRLRDPKSALGKVYQNAVKLGGFHPSVQNILLTDSMPATWIYPALPGIAKTSDSNIFGTPEQLLTMLSNIFSGKDIPSPILNGLYRLPPQSYVTDFIHGEPSILRYHFFIKGKFICLELARESGTESILLSLTETDRYQRYSLPLLPPMLLPESFLIDPTAEKQLLTMKRSYGEFCVGPRTRSDCAIIQNLNHKALFTPDSPENHIVCRHLAIQYMHDVNTDERGKVNLRGHYSDVRDIVRHVTQETETDYWNLKQQYSGRVIRSEDFGRLLKLIFEDMESNGIIHKPLFVYTIYHAMAVRLAIRQDEGEEKRYIVSVYDPNATGMAISSRVKLPAELATDIHCLGAYILDQGFANSDIHKHPVTILQNDKRPLPDLIYPPLSILAFFHCLETGDTQGVKHYINQIIHSESAEVLLRCEIDGNPGLNLALDRGKHKAIKIFSSGLMHLADIGVLSSTQIASLLTARRSDDISGLLLAVQSSQQLAVTEFIICVENLAIKGYLSLMQVIDLLAAKRKDGCTAMGMALSRGEHEIVATFSAAILRLADAGILAPKDIVNLFAAIRGDGVPGLLLALQEGHSETVTVFISAIESLARKGYLSEREIDDLLMAKNSRGIPGLLYAVEDRHFETRKAYINGVMQFIKMRYSMSQLFPLCIRHIKI